MWQVGDVLIEAL